MSKDALIDIINNNGNYNTGYLHNTLLQYNEFIQNNVNTELYEEYSVELNCLYYQYMYADKNDEYNDACINNVINSLTKIINLV